MSFKNFMKELNGNRVEGELIKTILYSLLTSFILLGILYFFKFQYISDFMPKYGFFLFFAVLSYALVIPAIRQVRAYKEFVCMTGMMVGMTIGMIAGFLAGFFLASTNGMFYGSVFGMSVGIFLGVWNGKCCGIMGVMEGMTAGFMGGLMGAMTSIMMLNDNLKVAGAIVFAFSAIILFGLNYMIYFEMKNSERQKKEDQFLTITISFILTAITAWLMVFGPRSVLFQ
ncbi:MAG TPA: hypothetical protein VJ208_00880 [Candidatus Nanoarchaeia archaeon]|nr:hypothetical protein [Candidatus Nanoarchaeia archaeon]